MGGWTLFFWAFWLAWGPFVGVFLARISRGRTLREFVIAAITAPVPMFTGRMSRETDVYYRLEVFTQTGSGGYDMMGLTRQQVIDDVLERYEAHLAFLTRTAETDTSSVLTPSVLPKDESAMPRDAGDIHDLDNGQDR